MKPEYRGLLYEQTVNLALTRLGYIATPQPTFDSGYDIQVHDDDGHIIAVELKAYAQPVPGHVIRRLSDRYTNFALPVLLVTSTPLTPSARELLATANFEHVMWSDESDDAQLRAKLQEIFSRLHRAK
jgi:Restriction endonuclease